MEVVSADQHAENASAKVSSDNDLLDRSYWLVTKLHQYFFRVRNRSIMKTFGVDLSTNETEALALWSDPVNISLSD